MMMMMLIEISKYDDDDVDRKIKSVVDDDVVDRKVKALMMMLSVKVLLLLKIEDED